MKDIELIVNSETGFVTDLKKYVIKQENLQRKIIYKFSDEFVDGTAYLCVRKEDGIVGKIQMTKNGEQYELQIKNGLVSNTKSIEINIKIVQDEQNNQIPIFVSTISKIKVEDTIVADMDLIDYYPDWHDTIEGELTTIKADISDIEQEQTVQNTNISYLQTNKADKTEIPTSLSDLTEDSEHRTVTDIEKSNWNEKVDIDVNNLTNYELKTNTGSTIELSINSSTYVMTLNLKNSAGTTISTGTIDLPLETMVVNASYDSTTKEIVLTLQSGSTVRFSVADLVSGLQSEITPSNKLSSDLVDDTNSINKFTNASEKSKLSGIETGAEVNKIEDIKVNGTSQSITNKSVDISVPTNTVSSTNVRTILSLTQAEYDNITTPDTNTMYVIKEA